VAVDSLTIEHKYVPFPKQLIAHQTKARHLLFGGAVGPGKTRFEVEHIFAKMQRWPGIRILLGRYNYIDLQRTTELEWKRSIDNRLWAPEWGGSYNEQTHAYTFGNGSTLYLTDLKNWERWMSAELGMIVIDEVSEVGEDVYNALETRLRWTTGEGDCQDEYCLALPNYRPHNLHPFYQMVTASNPTPRWPKQRWYDRWSDGTLPKSHAFIQALTEDNPALPPDYEKNLMENNNPMWVRRMLRGDWTAFEGATFQNFSRATHCWPPGEEWEHLIEEVYGGIDWGATTTYAHRTAATLTARLKQNMGLLTIWEYSKQGPAASDFFAQLRMAQKRWKVRGWFADASQPRAVEALREQGLPLIAAARHNGARSDRTNLLARLFEIRPSSDRPGLMLLERCTHTITGIETYHEVPQSEATRGFGAITDEPVRRDDDEVDALGYNVDGMNRMRPVVDSRPLVVVNGGGNPSPVKTPASKIIAERQRLRNERLQAVLSKWELEDG
jgi:hypothetical protein